jgi:Sulfatase
MPYTIPLAQKTFSPKGKLLEAAGKPNIYYIIFDSYTSSESLRRYWQYDNTPFEDSLRNLGFFVTKNCKTNYDFTPYCMASYLNGSDLELSDYRSKNELNREPFNNTFALVKQSNVATYLNGLGYKTINYSLFDVGAEKALYYSMWHDDGVRDATVRGLLGRTFWQTLYTKLEFYKNPKRAVEDEFPNMKILQMLGDSSLAQQKQPVFVYAHVMMPHFPFCFDENGKRVTIDNQLAPEAQFLGQLRYTNVLALKVIRQILANEKGKQPLIIIQGDHGYRQLFKVSLADRRREGHSIFNAYRVPELMQPQLNDTIRPIEGFWKLF